MSVLATIFGSQPAAQPTETTAAPTNQEATPVTPEPQGLDKFNELINFTPDPESAPKPFDPSTLIHADPEQLQQQISQMNFVQGAITKEDAEAIMGGGEGAIGAMAKALNNVAQKAFMQATLAAKNISSETLKQSLSHLDTRVDERLKNQQVNSALAQANPVLAHPAAQPMIAAIMPKIQAKYPSATPEEIRDHAVNYITEFVNAVNPPKKDDTPRHPGQVDNWANWIEE